MKRGRKGNMVLEVALWMPVLLLLIVGMVQFGKLTYLYYSLKKIEYAAARYLAVQPVVDFCDPAFANAAIQFAITDNTTGAPLIANLTPDMLQVTTQCIDPVSGAPGQCDVSGCGGPASAQRPDFVVVSIPNGYRFPLRIPYIQLDPINLVPSVTAPFGGSSL